MYVAVVGGKKQNQTQKCRDADQKFKCEKNELREIKTMSRFDKKYT